MTNINQSTGYLCREYLNGITQNKLLSIFDYKDGILYWKINRGTKIKAGSVAGGIGGTLIERRWQIKIDGKTYQRARLIFLLHKGYLPFIVDHKDRKTLNDAIGNLRAATRLQNNYNRNSNRNSTSKYVGVSLYKNNKWVCWTAQINIEGKNKRLGYFKTEDEAALAYNKYAEIHRKEFANLNIINNADSQSNKICS